MNKIMNSFSSMCFSSFFAPQNCQNDTRLQIQVNKWCIFGHKLQFLKTNLYLISRTSSSMYGYVTECAVVLPWFHQCLLTKSSSAQRFHEQHLCVFQNVVTFSSESENNFVWKRTFLNSPTPSRKRAEAAEEKRKILQCFFRSLVVFTLLYSHSQHRFSHKTAFLSKTSIAFRKQRDISTTLCKVSAREEHKQENVAYHTRATCAHPTINKQPSMYSVLNVLLQRIASNLSTCAFLLSLTFDKCWQDLYSDEVQSYRITSLIMQIQITPHIALQECV